MWNSKHSYSGSQSSRKKSVFGGKVKPHHEVKALNEAIEKKEQEDFAAFEEKFHAQADSIWGDGEPKQKTKSNLTAKEKLMILSRLQLNLKKMMNKQNQNT